MRMQRYIDYFVLPNFYICFLHTYSLFTREERPQQNHKDRREDEEDLTKRQKEQIESEREESPEETTKKRWCSQWHAEKETKEQNNRVAVKRATLLYRMIKHTNILNKKYA